MYSIKPRCSAHKLRKFTLLMSSHVPVPYKFLEVGQNQSKGVPGLKFVPGVGKFFLASNLDPPPPSPTIYSNFARENSLFGHYVMQNM